MADVSIKLTVSGMEELQRYFSETVPRAFTDGVNGALEDLSNDIYDQTRAACPVDTGALRDSIGVTVSDNRLEAEATQDYASFVDEGTSKMDAEPFFESVIDGLTAGFEQKIEQKINDMLQIGR